MASKKQAVEKFLEGKVASALNIAKGFKIGVTDKEREVMSLGYECAKRPEDYKQMGYDTEKCFDDAVQVLKQVLDIQEESVEEIKEEENMEKQTEVMAEVTSNQEDAEVEVTGSFGYGIDLDSSRRKMNCSKSFTKMTIPELEALSDDWGYEPGELTELAEDGEQTLGAKFLGLAGPDDEYFVFKTEDGSVKAYEMGAGAWGDVMDLDSSRRKMNCSTSEKLSAADQEKILGLFSKAGVKVTSSFDDTDTHDGVAYNLFCVETENRSVPVRGSLQSDLHELESQDIGYDVEVGPNGFYSRTYQFYYYEDEPTSENRCWHARPRV